MSRKRAKYRMQKSMNDVLSLTDDDLYDDHLFSESVVGETPVVRIALVCAESDEHVETSVHHLTKDQISYLKQSLKDYPELIKEMSI